MEVDGPSDAAGAPGEVISIEKDRFMVMCGDETVLAIEEMQPEGKRRMSVQDFLNGTRVEVGAILGRKENET